jgi:hypothetical protein
MYAQNQGVYMQSFLFKIALSISFAIFSGEATKIDGRIKFAVMGVFTKPGLMSK